jgi:phage shock protein C
MQKRLYRSRDNRMLAGVCGGLAKYFNWDPVLVRVIAVAAMFVSFCLAIVVYIILAVVVPLEDRVDINNGINQGRN